MFGLNIAFEFFFTFISSEQDKLKKGEHQPNCICLRSRPVTPNVVRQLVSQSVS